MSDVDEALKKLHVALFRAKEFRQNNPRGGRIAAILAINGIVEFIDSVDELKSQELSVPLGMLGAALADLEGGTVSDMLKPAPRPRGGRPKDPTNWENIKGQAAATMEFLMYVPGREAAAKSVAAVLKREGIKLDNDIELTWRTVAGWRDQIKSSRTKSEAKETFRYVLKINQELSGREALLKKLDDPAKKAKFRNAILNALTMTLRNFRD
jgi:hypothetical protein